MTTKLIGWLSAGLLCVAGRIAAADTLTCQFTEPYLTIVHDTAAATVSISGLNVAKRRYERVGLELLTIHSLGLTWGDGARLELTLDYRGSDLMSDHVFPISARYFANGASTRPLHGGCSTAQLPMIIPIDPPE